MDPGARIGPRVLAARKGLYDTQPNQNGRRGGKCEDWSFEGIQLSALIILLLDTDTWAFLGKDGNEPHDGGIGQRRNPKMEVKKMNAKRTIMVSTIVAVALVISVVLTASPGSSDNSENFTISLKPGFNLVSFAVVDENTTPNHVFAPLTYGPDYTMFYWNAPFGPYSQPSPTTALKDNTGYWV